MTSGESAAEAPPARSADIFAKCPSRTLDDYRAAEELGLNPFYRELSSEIGPTIRYAGSEVIMLGSNNYLGLTTDPRVKKAAMDAVARYGTGVTGSRLLNGTLPLHTELEELLADWVGMEKALVFTTGYTANLGLISTLVQEGDAVFCDSAAHASLVDGARLADGTLRAFFHNRPNSLRRGLRSWRSQPDAGGVLVAVDGIYSMEGDWAPLTEVRACATSTGPACSWTKRMPWEWWPAWRRHGRGHRGAGGPHHGHLFQVAGQLWRFHRRPGRRDRFSAAFLPAHPVHGVQRARVAGRRPGGGQDRPGRKTGAARSCWAWRSGCGPVWRSWATTSAATRRAPSCRSTSMTSWGPGCSGGRCSTGVCTRTVRCRRRYSARCCGPR